MCVVFTIFAGGTVEQANVFQEVPHLPISVLYLGDVAISAYEAEIPDVGAVRPM
jgi:hypothetical protein